MKDTNGEQPQPPSASTPAAVGIDQYEEEVEEENW